MINEKKIVHGFWFSILVCVEACIITAWPKDKKPVYIILCTYTNNY